LNKLLNKSPGGKLKMQIIANGSKISEVEWSASVLKDNLKMSTGIILSLKR